MSYQNPHGLGCPWSQVTETFGAPNIKWCEETLCHWISEPANAWSNLGYLFVGIWIWHHSRKKPDSHNLKQFGLIIFFMGLMSFFYHLSNFYGSQLLDFIGMFFFVGWAIGMNLIRLGVLNNKRLLVFNILLVISLTGVVHLMYLAHLKFQILILFSAMVIIATEFIAQRKKKDNLFWFYITMGLLLIALSFSIIDGQKIWCDPSSHGWFTQGHALWHWIASIAMATFYRHYESLSLKAE
jgi:hypothetical protein